MESTATLMVLVILDLAVLGGISGFFYRGIGSDLRNRPGKAVRTVVFAVLCWFAVLGFLLYLFLKF